MHQASIFKNISKRLHFASSSHHRCFPADQRFQPGGSCGLFAPLWLWRYYGNDTGTARPRSGLSAGGGRSSGKRNLRWTKFTSLRRTGSRHANTTHTTRGKSALTTERHYSGSRPFPGHTERQHSGWDEGKREQFYRKL